MLRTIKAVASPVRLEILSLLKDPVAKLSAADRRRSRARRCLRRFHSREGGDRGRNGVASPDAADRRRAADRDAQEELDLLPSRRVGDSTVHRVSHRRSCDGDCGESRIQPCRRVQPSPVRRQQPSGLPRRCGPDRRSRCCGSLRRCGTSKPSSCSPPVEPGTVAARIFDLFEELPFAGHPVIGAAAVLHMRSEATGAQRWRFQLPSKTVEVTTEVTGRRLFRLAGPGHPGVPWRRSMTALGSRARSISRRRISTATYRWRW